MDRYRVLITGDRYWDCADLARLIVSRLRDRYGSALLIVAGGARGVDRAFTDACRELGVEVEEHLADWNRYGKAAGPRRNAEMLGTSPTVCLAFHRDLAKSKGTRNMVQQCLKAGIPTWIIEEDQGMDTQPRRLKAI